MSNANSTNDELCIASIMRVSYINECQEYTLCSNVRRPQKPLIYSDKEVFTKLNLTSDRQSSKIKASEKFDFHSLLFTS